MKVIIGAFLLLFGISSMIGGSQQNEGGWSEGCNDLVRDNQPLNDCYRSLKDHKPEAFCNGQEDGDCIEILQPFLECVGEETRAQKEAVIAELRGKCILQSVESGGAMTTGAGVVIPSLLVAMAAALN